MSGEDLTGGAGDQEHAAVRERACRKRARERREARLRRGAVARAAERQRRERRDDLDLGGPAGERVPAAVADLEIAADAERDEEEAEEGRNREAKPGLCALEAEARRRRARHSQDGTRARGYARGVRPRHPPCPFGFTFAAQVGGRAASPESPSLESPFADLSSARGTLARKFCVAAEFLARYCSGKVSARPSGYSEGER